MTGILKSCNAATLACNKGFDYISFGALVVATITLIFTIITLLWFKNDRVKQNKKEFEQLIFSNIKSISSYCLDIAKIFDNKSFHGVDKLKEAEEQIYIGFTYLRSYALAHRLNNLVIFATGNNGDKKINETSFAYNFFNISNKYIKYREKMFLANRKIGRQRNKLNKYYSLFNEYLSFGIRYADSVLNNKESENKHISNFNEDFKDIIDFAKEKKLL